MRKTSQKQGFVFDQQGTVTGVALGYDFCAEHEFGVSSLRDLFEVEYKERGGWEEIPVWLQKAEKVKVGLASRKINTIPKDGSFILIEYYAVDKVWSVAKNKFLAKYPEAKKVLTAKNKHAVLLADSHQGIAYAFSAIKHNEQQTLAQALQPYKVGENHYVLDKSKDAMSVAKTLKQVAYLPTLNIASVFDSFGYRSSYHCNGLSDWDDRHFMSTAWDDSSFGIHVKTDLYVDWLRQIFDAFMQKDVCFVGQVTGNSWNKVDGLVLGLYSKLYDAYNEHYITSDINKLTLAKAFTRLKLNEIRRQIEATWIEPSQIKDDELIVWVNTNYKTGFDSGYYLAKDIIAFANDKTQLPVRIVSF